jgi:hypothetical protein
MRCIVFDDDDGAASLVGDANRGLIAMRRGDSALGEKLYRKSINGFRHLQRQTLARTALAFLPERPF